MASSNEWTRVIVLTPAPASGTVQGGALSPKLKSLFAERDWFAVVHHDPYVAMAELCLREKAQAARSGWGLQRLEKLALAIVDVKESPELSELLQAIRDYVPSATLWRASDHEVVPINLQASPLNLNESPSNFRKPSPLPSSPLHSLPPHAEPPKSTQPKSTQLITETEADEIELNSSAQTRSAALTRQEIDMLLAGDREAKTNGIQP